MQTIKDFVTGKAIPASPEESVRQEYEHILVEDYGYKKSEVDIEVQIPRWQGYFPDRADIVIFKSGGGRDPASDILGIVEVKRSYKKEGLAQLKSYMTATSAIWGVWTNGDDIAYICRPSGKQTVLEDYLNNIPARGQSIQDVGRIKKQNLKPFGRSELKSAFRRILRKLYANTNISRREKLGGEMIKLIFSKIEDEKTYIDRVPYFRVEAGEDPNEVKSRIVKLFERVKEELKNDDVFSLHETITLDAKAVTWVVGQLERSSFLKTDTDVVGSAFEIFAESRLVGEKGEFFTPRGIIDIAIQLVDPQPEESICDPACGSGGFLIHAMKHIWEIMDKSPKWKNSPRIQELKQKLASRSLFGIDKENDLVKIAKAYMAISGDGRSNIIHENSLHEPKEFTSIAKQVFIKNNAFKKFDVVLTNPPFGAKTKVVKSSAKNFQLGHNWKKEVSGQWKKDKVCERDPYILFVERCLDILSEKGRLAIVLPETAFHAPKTEYLREFILKKVCIQAIIDLPHNAFRPHCNAKTCLLVATKKSGHKSENIIMATPKQMGHDHQGRPLYQPGTQKIWDDLISVKQELNNPGSKKNKFVFLVPYAKITDNLIPAYYKGLMHLPKAPKGQVGVKMEALLDQGIIGAWDGHGSPPSESKGQGPVPYIRVADIVNWELYRNPVSGISKEIYHRMTKNKEKVVSKDILFVRRGSFRIGTVAMASPRDREILLTRELLTFRVLKEKNPYKINAFYLLWLLSSEFIQKQIESKVFVDTTLPNIGHRWKELILPIHKDTMQVAKISKLTESAIRKKWKAQDDIQQIRDITHSPLIT